MGVVAAMRSWGGPRAILARWRVLLAVLGLLALVTDAIVVGFRTHPGTATSLEGRFVVHAASGARGSVELPGSISLPGAPADVPVEVDIPVTVPEGSGVWGLYVGEPTYEVAATWDGVPLTAGDGAKVVVDRKRSHVRFARNAPGEACGRRETEGGGPPSAP